MDNPPPTGNHRPMSSDATKPRDEVAARWLAFELFDPDGPEADEILEQLAFYESVGVTPEEYAGTAPANLIAEINLRLITPGRRVERSEVESASGLSTQQFDTVCRAAGYDPHGTFTDTDVAAFSGFSAAVDFFTPEELEALVRVMRSLMSHLADALTAIFRIDISIPMDVAGASAGDVARKNFESAQLMRLLPGVLEAFLMNEMASAVVRSDQSRQHLDSSNTATVKMAVGFVDIVGYTPIADRLEPDELGQFILDFERRAADAVAAFGGRVVKLIGDEVMFVVVDPNAAFDIARALVAAFAESEATPRGGVIFGELVARGGDYYGRLVNMASRITDLAVPGEVLTDVATAAAATRQNFDHAGRRTLKGFTDPVELRSLA
jgi:adenylate cyclase